MEDIKLVCKDCGAEFVWTVGEQEFYQQKGLTHQPVRCKACRIAKKAKQISKEVHNDTKKDAE